MQPSSLSPDDLHVLLREANAASRRFERRFDLPRHDHEDVRQDLLADVLARLPAFDPGRGSMGAFAVTVFAHRLHRLGQLLDRNRTRFGSTPISLDEPAPGKPHLVRADLIAEDDGYLALMGQVCDLFPAAECRVDVARVLASLPEATHDLVRHFAKGPARNPGHHTRTSRSGYRRQVLRLRLDLRMRGL